MTILLKFFCCLFFLSSMVYGQDIYLVYFTDKAETSFDPFTYFDQKALERRLKNKLPLYDQTDLPVRQDYIDAIDKRVMNRRHVLRWFNAVSVEASNNQINQLVTLPFVRKIEPLHQYPSLAYELNGKQNRFDTLLSLTRGLMELDRLEERGLTGKGVRIAIFDAGFKDADTHPALKAVRDNGHILHAHDFYDGDDQVYHHSLHGMQVMSCIAGEYDGRQLGCAKDAEFLLARIEHESKEKAIEEDHWMAAAEWADKLGADLINSSVTYTDARYTYSDMDGARTPVSRAARIASEKGMLVVCSMGNEGDKNWRFMGAPADVPEVLSVGGSLPMMPMHIKFASVGPNAKGMMKPDIAAPGFVLSAIKKELFGENAGTSFSAPLITGLAACILQAQPTLGREELAQTLRESGHFYPYYDYELGYGVPKASRLFEVDSLSQQPTFEVSQRFDTVWVAFDQEVMQDSANFPNGRVLYYHLEDRRGMLRKAYSVRIPNRTLKYYFLRRIGVKGNLRIWFAGYLHELKVD